MIAETAFELVIPAMADIIDVGVKNYDVSLFWRRGCRWESVPSFPCLPVLLYAYAARAAYGWGANVREAEFEKVVQSYAFSNLDHFETSSLVTRMTTDVTVLQNALTGGIRPLVRSPIMMLMGIGLSAWMNPKLAWSFW